MKTIAVIGSGVVGQATGKGFLKKGYKVIFVDNDPTTIWNLKKSGHTAFLADDLPSDIDIEISMFSTSTPLTNDDYGSVDLGHMNSALVRHARWLKSREHRLRYHLVVIRSTVPPGTTRNVFIPLLELHSHLKASKDFGICMQPEFLREARSEQDFLHPRAIVIGELDSKSGQIMEQLYKEFRVATFRTSIETAEFMKYVQNCFNATKISFANEMWALGQVLHVDANAALEMAAMSAEGFWNAYYGIVGGKPYRGKCLPKDIKGLLNFAKKNGFHMPLLSAVDSVNEDFVEKTKFKKEMLSIFNAGHELRSVKDVTS